MNLEIETEIDLKTVLDWCEENSYVLVKKRKPPLQLETVIEIAEKACYLHKDESKDKTRTGSNPFAKYLATTYLYNYMPPNKIAKSLKIHHTMIPYAINQKLFHKSEFKYLKPWQQNALKHFINEVQILGGVIQETNIKH